MRTRVRLYDPTLGRFLQTDPVEGGSANDYDYVNGDPVNQFDLAGTCSTHHRGLWGAVRSARCHASRVPYDKIFNGLSEAAGLAVLGLAFFTVSPELLAGVALFAAGAAIAAEATKKGKCRSQRVMVQWAWQSATLSLGSAIDGVSEFPKHAHHLLHLGGKASGSGVGAGGMWNPASRVTC